MHSLLYIADRIVKKNNNPIENFAFMLLKSPYTIKDKFDFFNKNMTNDFFTVEMSDVHFAWQQELFILNTRFNYFDRDCVIEQLLFFFLAIVCEKPIQQSTFQQINIV